VRVLLDENIPRDFAALLSGHDVATVQGLGWAGVKNGELLRRAGAVADVFLTMDRNMERQHELARLSFGVVLLKAKSNRIVDLQPLVEEVLIAISGAKPGDVRQVGG